MVICSPYFMSNVTLIDRPSMQIEIFCYYDWISFPSICRHVWYTKFRSVATYGRGIGEIFLLNIGLPFNPLKMAQFIKLTGGLLIIIEIWGYSKIETCVSTILRLRSYVIQSKWACFLLREQIFLSIFSAPLDIIPQGEQKSLSSSYRKSQNRVDGDLSCPMHSN